MLKNVAKAVNLLMGRTLRRSRIFISSSLNFLGRPRTIDKNYFDYIRLSSLELVSHEIHLHKLKGSVAELGVYKGKFAKYINQYFSDRPFYLFDTFQGFDTRDISSDRSKNFSTGDQNFSDTSVQSVLKRMPFPEKCIPVKGFFPDSAHDVEDRFVFVSLDADLYEPIYQGLHFFYPRLAEGGYIFVHDFNNDAYNGVRQAVEKFCSERSIGFTPLPDSGGTAILTK
jgi:O-methyltransferase